MEPTVEVAFIAAVPGTIAAIGVIILGIWNARKLKQIDHNVNGKLTRLLDEKVTDRANLAEKSEKLSHAEGRREGIESKEN